MAETTNLKLFKHDEPLKTNKNKFDIDKALNQNWDKIDKETQDIDKRISKCIKQDDLNENLKEISNQELDKIFNN